MHFSKTRINGNLLPDRTLCLTYDDGPGVTQTPSPDPGPRTDDLAFYLFLQGIPATFFVMGEHAASEPELCRQMMRWGHLVVNHTHTHNGLPWESPAAMIADVLDAALAIGEATNSDSLLLRPPYGEWSDDVAKWLNSDPDARKFTGPILYDIGANDWTFWQDASKSPSQQLADCVTDYYDQITRARRGVVVMHDSSQSPVPASMNQTYEMTRLLVPLLVADGYRFIRLDAVPQVRSAMQVSSVIGLKATNGLYLSPQGGGGSNILVNGPGLNAWEELGLVQLDGGKQAIRTSTGQFMSTQPSGDVLANGEGIYDWEIFELLDQGNGSVALRASNGNYVSVPSLGQVVATASGIGQDELLIVEYIA